LSLTATGRLGYGDLEPNARLDIVSETIERRLTFSVFRELAAVDEDARHLGLGNSLLAAIAGRDDGDYYRRSGVSLEWTPPQSERRDLRVRGFAEYQRGAASAIDHALFKLGNDAFRFREGLVADKGWLYGGQIELTPWWGSDPNLVQGGLEFRAEAATGDFEYARGMLVARLAVPLPADIHLGIEAGAGTSRGDVTMQRLWHVGGPSSLRGYDPLADHLALTSDLAGRRVDRVSPHDSLFLTKSTSHVPHEGGQVLDPESPAHRLLLSWIEQGAALVESDPRPISLRVVPEEATIPMPGMGQQFVTL